MQIPTLHAVSILSNLMLHDPRDYQPVVASLDLPVSFIGSDLAWAHQTAETINTLRPDALTTNIPGTSHLLYVDHPDRFNQALDEVLAQLNAH